jgi:hypothetical protein
MTPWQKMKSAVRDWGRYLKENSQEITPKLRQSTTVDWQNATYSRQTEKFGTDHIAKI